MNSLPKTVTRQRSDCDLNPSHRRTSALSVCDCSVLQPSSIRRLATPWTYFLYLSLSSVILIDSNPNVTLNNNPDEERCYAGFAPGTPCTMDSSSLGARRRRNQYDATGSLACARRDAMTSLAAAVSTGLHNGPLCVQICRHPCNQTYTNISQRR